MKAGSATAATRAAIDAAAATLPFADRQDFEDACRGFLGRSGRRQVLGADGRVVWDLDAYDFLRDAGRPRP